MPLAALVATTLQVVARITERVAPETEQPEPVVTYDTAPTPEPPEVVNVIVLPAGLVSALFVIFIVD